MARVRGSDGDRRSRLVRCPPPRRRREATPGGPAAASADPPPPGDLAPRRLRPARGGAWRSLPCGLLHRRHDLARPSVDLGGVGEPERVADHRRWSAVEAAAEGPQTDQRLARVAPGEPGSRAQAETRPDDLKVVVRDSAQPAAAIARQLRRLDHDEAQAVRRYLLVAASVVERPLLTSVDPADRHTMRLVEMRNGQVVLHFAVLHHQPVAGPEAVNRKPDPPTRGARVAAEPVEAMLPAALLSEHLVAERQYVRLVAVATPHGRDSATIHPATANTARRDRFGSERTVGLRVRSFSAGRWAGSRESGVSCLRRRAWCVRWRPAAECWFRRRDMTRSRCGRRALHRRAIDGRVWWFLWPPRLSRADTAGSR